jgi:small subunit ribosomal protein S6
MTRELRAYELMVIISGDLDENAAHGWLKTITTSVTGVGGSIHGNPDWWGRRRLAYPINKREDAYYAVFQLLAPAGALDEVERGFRISDDIVRHKLLRLPDHEAARRGMLATA